MAVMPSEVEIPTLVPSRGSVAWRIAGDGRLLAAAGYALLLQVSHPTVGAGVAEHSNFKEEPWRRLWRTLDYSYTIVYGAPEVAARMGRRVRALHKSIRGVTPDGQSYRALDPEPYAWVHATLAQAIVVGHRTFIGPLRDDRVEQFWTEWLGIGRLLGIRDGELPGDWRAFEEYRDRMIAERLELNQSVRDVLETIADPSCPPVPLLGERAWRITRVPMVSALSLTTVGLLPPLLRKRFGLTWTDTHEVTLRAFALGTRVVGALAGPGLRHAAERYARSRRIET